MTPYILNLCDLALTLYAIHRGGVELNPMMQNPAVMVTWKVVGVGVLCGMLHVLAKDKRVPTKPKRMARRGLRLCTCAFTLACINNLIIIKTL